MKLFNNLKDLKKHIDKNGIRFHDFKTLNFIADTQLKAYLEKKNSKNYTLRKHSDVMPYITFDSLRDVAAFLTSKTRF
jgi:hypothetical protein